MIILQSEISAEHQKEYLRHFFMIELIFTATYRFNDTEEPISDTLGSVYSPRTFKFSDIASASGMSVTQIDVTIDDTDQLISALLLGEDVRNAGARIHIGVVTSALVGSETITEIFTQEFYRGIIGGWTLSEDNKAKITIKNELVLWNKKALRTQSSSCPWTFKGTECAYAGAETWCDQGYDRCTDLGNTNYFGGFRFLPAIMEKEVWWGRTQAV